MPDLTPDTWAQIRQAYEHSDRPVADICAEHGISTGTLRDRVRRWRWTRRRPPVPREGPPAVAGPREFVSPPPMSEANGGEGSGVGGLGSITTIDPPTPTDHPTPTVFAGAQTVDPPPPGEGNQAQGDPAALAPRLQSAVARVLPAIEATLARLAAGPQAPREMEQTARALGALMRTLRELNALLAQQPPRAADDDDMPENIDEFRFELARRIRAFVGERTARRNAEAAEAAAQALDEDVPEDIDAFREKLAQKIEAFMESRGDEEFEEDADEAAPANE